MERVSSDPDIDWNTLREHEKRHNPEWESVARNWKFFLVRALVTPGRYLYGGNRSVLRAKGAKQQEVLNFVQTSALAVPLNEDDEAVAEGCVTQVSQRWQTNNREILCRVVRQTTLRLRREQASFASHPPISSHPTLWKHCRKWGTQRRPDVELRGECDATDDSSLIATFDQQTISDVTRSTPFVSDMSLTCVVKMMEVRLVFPLR